MLQLNNYGLWDLIVAFPPCTHLASSGARWFKDKQAQQDAAVRFVLSLAAARCDRIAIENPIGVLSTKWRKPDQIIQPWMFGHPESKATCLWLKGLPKLVETKNVKIEMEKLPLAKRTRVHYALAGARSLEGTLAELPGLASAMAEQWGSL